jgi:hypothetical protein
MTYFSRGTRPISEVHPVGLIHPVGLELDALEFRADGQQNQKPFKTSQSSAQETDPLTSE